MSCTKRLSATVLAVVVMGLVVGSASANRLSISSLEFGPTFSTTFSPLAIVTSDVSTVASCEVRLEGSFHSRTLQKVDTALIGHVSRASVGLCGMGHATVLSERLPWHVAYHGFTGRLPQISTVAVKLIGMSFRIEEFGFFCLFRTTVERPAEARLELDIAGAVAFFRFESFNEIPSTGSGGFGCPIASLHLQGTGTMGRTVTLTLI